MQSLNIGFVGLGVMGTPMASHLARAGFPGNDLSDAQQQARFDDCMAYAPRPLPPAQRGQFLQALQQLDRLDDARRLSAPLVD